jgi:predicted  nucleic acid-binding Zn-ribbon protein
MDLKALFDLQQVDISIDQARHALDHLAERTAHGHRQQELVRLRSQRDDIRREQQTQESDLVSIESESAAVDTHRARLEAQLKTVIAPREAEALQHEIATLTLKRSDLDDRGIELLEAAGRAEERLIHLLQREDEAVEAEEMARDDLDRALSIMNAEIERLLLRSEAVTIISPADLEEYDKRRKSFGGIAVAEIKHGVCGGCHMDISISELDAIKRLPAEAIAECPNCIRLLVR